MNSLPPELILQILRHLDDFKPLQIKLALLNSRIYQLIIPSVYKRIVIAGSDKIVAFCSSISSPNSTLCIYVEFLQLALPCLGLAGDTFNDSCTISTILNNLVNLQELELLGHAAVSLWDHLSLAPLLQLTRVKTVSYPGRGFVRFLHHQRPIQALDLIEPCCDRRASAIDSIAVESSFLPALTELSASIQHIIEIVPKRRIHKVDILPNGRARTRELGSLVGALCESSVPVVSVGFWITSIKFAEHSGWDLIELLSETKVAMNLRTLAIGMRIQVGIHRFDTIALYKYISIN